MIPAIRSEFRKLFTVRSTYVIIILCALLVMLFAFYGDGYRASPATLHNPNQLAYEARQAVQAVSFIGALIGVLLITHEYRYNTITYTLTSSRSRTISLMSKFLVMSIFAIVFSLFFGAFSSLMAYAGMQVHGYTLVHQVYPYKDVLWRCLFYGWAYFMLDLIIAAIIRVQVGAIVAVFLIPTTIETLLGNLLLKKNGDYLPHAALLLITDNAKSTVLSTSGAVVVSLIYVAVGIAITWLLFLKRDAN